MTDLRVVGGELAAAGAERRHLLSIADLDARRRRAAARDRTVVRASRRSARTRSCRHCAAGLILNVFYESSTRTSSSFELAAKRLSADTMTLKSVRLVGRQGRVAEGHGADALARTTPT